MAARATWKGTLKVGSKTLPVHLYTAVQDRGVHFHLLEARTKQRVKQRMVNGNTGKEVPPEKVRKGYETDDKHVVFLEKEEIDSVQPENTDVIEISAFLPLGGIPHQWYERPLYVGPDGEENSYFALAEALARQKREGLARWVMRQKEYYGSLRERDGYLVVIALRYADQVVSADELPRPAGREPDPREIKMAEQLMAVLEGGFHPEEYRDEYRDRVMAFIEEKAKGRNPKLAAIPSKKATASLLDALAASIQSAGGKKVA